MIYFGENNEYILCECETCKGEMYIDRNSVAEEDAYAYHLSAPIKCRCGAVDEYINRAKKSCHRIKHELFALSDLLHKQQNVSGKISDITSELNRRFEPPSFLQSVGRDILFAGKVFLILIGAVIGVEIFLFIITALMFFFGLLTGGSVMMENANELFYSVNIFKERGGDFLSKFGLDSALKPLADYGDPAEGLVFGYIPAALTGLVIFVFYIFLAVLIVRVLINVAKLTFFASKVMNQKIKVNQKREEYQKQLDNLSVIYQNLCEQISEFTVIPDDYKNTRATDSILRYFINNRTDTIRDAVNLYHDEDFRSRLLEYNKAMYAEARQTRRYTKALYMMTSDENIKVDIREVKDDAYGTNSNSESDSAQVGEMLRGAFSKIKKSSSSSKKIARITAPRERPESPEIKETTENAENTADTENTEEKKSEDILDIPPVENHENYELFNEFKEISDTATNENDESGESNKSDISDEKNDSVNTVLDGATSIDN